MIDPETVERYQRDGAVCIRQLFRPERNRDAADGHRSKPRRLESARHRRQHAERSGALRRGLLQLAGQCALPPLYLRLAPGRNRREAHAQQHRAPVPRPYADQGTQDPAGHPVASRSALLQHRGPAKREFLDSGRSCEPRIHAATRGGNAFGTVADAAHLHGRRSEVVSGRFAGRSARYRRVARQISNSRLGDAAGRCRLLSHAHAARRARRHRRRAAPGVLRAVSRR